MIETVLIEQEGPIAFVESTTLTNIFEEDKNRALLVATDDREEQTRRIVIGLACRHANPSPTPTDRLKALHRAIQRMLPIVDVRVPFADRIAAKFNCQRVEVRRAFPQLLALIQASALLHFRQREIAADGTLLAADTDYQIARRLISKPFALSLGGGISDSVSRFFEVLKPWATGPFTTKDAKKKGTASKGSIQSWLWELYEAGAVEIVEQGRGSTPNRWRLTGNDPAPGASLIPSVEDIFPEYQTRDRNAPPKQPQRL